MFFNTVKQKVLFFTSGFVSMFLSLLIFANLEGENVTPIRLLLSILGFLFFCFSIFFLAVAFSDFICFLVKRKRNKMLERYFDNIKDGDLQKFYSKNFSCVYGEGSQWYKVYVVEQDKDAFFTISGKGIRYSNAFSLVDNATKQIILEKFEKELFEAKELDKKRFEEQRQRENENYQRQYEVIRKIASES